GRAVRGGGVPGRGGAAGRGSSAAGRARPRGASPAGSAFLNRRTARWTAPLKAPSGGAVGLRRPDRRGCAGTQPVDEPGRGPRRWRAVVGGECPAGFVDPGRPAFGCPPPGKVGDGWLVGGARTHRETPVRRGGRRAWFHQSESATAMAMRSPPAPANQSAISSRL